MLFSGLVQDSGFAILVRVRFRARFLAPCKSFKSRWAHATEPGKVLSSPDIYRAPVARRLPRRESDFVAFRIDRLPQTVDPTYAQSFIHRLWPGNAGPPRTLLVETNPQLTRVFMMGLQPCP